MKQKMIIVFGSTTGNTQKVAEIIEKYFSNKISVENVAVEKANPKDLQNYDFIALGSSTWGDGELQDDFIPFYEEMENINLAGKKAVAFGTGETSWPQFCKAVDLIEEKLTENGAEISEGLKIDGDVEDNLEQIEEWLKEKEVFFGI